MAKPLADVPDIDDNCVRNSGRTAKGFVSIDDTRGQEGILVLLTEGDGGPRLFLSDSKTLSELGLELVTNALMDGTISPADLHCHLHRSDQLDPGIPKYLYPTPIPVDEIEDFDIHAEGVRGLVATVHLRDRTKFESNGAWVKEFGNAIRDWLRTRKRIGR